MVKCQDCGRLGVISRHNGKLIEATAGTRERGVEYLDGRYILAKIVCDAGKKDFSEACRIAQAPRELANEIGECASFVLWQPGRSPRDIEQMVVQQDVITLRREMLELSKAVHDWQQKQAEQQEAQYREILRVGESQAWGAKWQAIWTGIAVVLSVISIITTILFAAGSR